MQRQALSDMLMLTVQVGLNRVGREMHMVGQSADDQSARRSELPREFLARAHAIQALLIRYLPLILHHIAREEKVAATYLYTAMITLAKNRRFLSQFRLGKTCTNALKYRHEA